MAVFTVGAASTHAEGTRNSTAGCVFRASPRSVISRSDRGDLITALACARPSGNCGEVQHVTANSYPGLAPDSGL